MTGVLIRRGEDTDTYGRQMREKEIGETQLKDKESQGVPVTTRRWKRERPGTDFSLRATRRNQQP